MAGDIPQITQRQLNVFVFSRNRKPIHGAKVVIAVNGKDIVFGTTKGKDGAPLMMGASPNVTSVTLRAEYQYGTQLIRSPPVHVDLDERNFNIYLSEVEMPSDVPKWFPIAGYAAGVITLLFFMYVAAVQQGQANFAHVIVVAVGVALAAVFLGGDAAAKGAITLPFMKDNPLGFAFTGGIAVFVVVLGLGWALFLRGQSPEPQNPESVSMGFAQPREIGAVVQDLESAKDVTVAYSKSCPAEFAKTLVSAGTHQGDNPKDFLERLQERLREPPATYTVLASGRRDEIACK